MDIERKSPDYYADRKAAQAIVDSLMQYYHTRGFTKFSAWLEPEVQFSNRTFYNVRSNAVMRVPKF